MTVTRRPARGQHVPSRRAVLASALAAPLLGLDTGAARAQPVTEVLGFKTTADVAKAEAEGEVVLYTHDGEAGAAAVVAAFSKDFPKIRGSYVRAQNGALYSKLLAERSAGRFSADAVQFSDIGTGIDFQKRGGYDIHPLPESYAYDPRYLGAPGAGPEIGFFVAGVSFAGIGYNTARVPAADAPKTWKDLLDPRWRNAMSTKQVTSGTQFVEWFELRRLFGPGYWTEFAKQRPRGFDSRAQLFDRLAKGDDKVCALAEYAGYLLYHEKGAPIAFVAPPDGLPASPFITGTASKAPHPQAGRLFLDWLMSLRGQTFLQNEPQLYYGSVRNDAPAMPGGMTLRDFKLLYPVDTAGYLASRDDFVKEWNGMLGL